MTKEELENKREFSLLKNALKKAYPFVTDMSVVEDHEKYETVLFVNIFIDLLKLEEYMGDRIRESTQLSLSYNIMKNSPYITLFLPTLFDNEDTSSKARKVGNDINNKLRYVHSMINELLHDEQDILPHYNVSVSSYHVQPKQIMDYVKSFRKS